MREALPIQERSPFGHRVFHLRTRCRELKSSVGCQRGLCAKISHACQQLFFIEQDSPLGFTGIEKLKDKLLMVLENLHEEKEEERVTVDIWCHLGHAYITKVDEGEI